MKNLAIPFGQILHNRMAMLVGNPGRNWLRTREGGSLSTIDTPSRNV